MAEQFQKHARTVTLLTGVSRVTGLLRDAALSRIFGVGIVMDAFWFAFMIPNLFRRLFGEGALSAAFLPVYSKLNRDDPATARLLARYTISLMLIFLGGVTLVGELILFMLSALTGHEHLVLKLLMIMLPYMPLVCLVAVLGSMLQVHKRFGPTASAPVVMNICLITATVGLTRAFDRIEYHIIAVASSLVVAGLLQLAWSLLALKNIPWWANGETNPRSAIEPLKRVLNQAWPMFIGLGVLQLNSFLDGLIASYPTTIGSTIFGFDFPLDQGALASVSFAHRLYEFPLGVFGIAIATAIFPALSSLSDQENAFVNTLRRGLRLVIFIGLPASIGLIVIREPLTAAVLQGRNFSADDTSRVAFILMGYASAVWAYSMIHVLTRAFYAQGDSMTPVKVAVSMVALNVALNCTLIWTPLKEAGLAWSTAICSVLQVIFLLRLTRKQVIDWSVQKAWLQTVCVTLLMTGGLMFTTWQLRERELTWTWAVIQLLIVVPIGVGIVALSSIVLRMPELKWALGFVDKK